MAKLLTRGSRAAAAAALLTALGGTAAAEIRFREVAAAWGVDFSHRHGGTGELYMIETVGSGVVVFDYDLDGDQDLLFVDSGRLPLGQEALADSRLYRNDGSGRFVDVSARTRLAADCYGMGATAADVDADGDPDLYLTCYGANRLLRNEGDGTFRDTTAEASAGDSAWGASASFADTDRDGDLDLYVTNYVDFTFDNNPPCGVKETGLRSYCHPDVYDGLADVFYRNRGDGTFEEATAAAGFGGASGKGLGVAFSDLNGDGWPDLYVANDMTANFLFFNRGDGTFQESALLAGAALGQRGEPEAGMGIALGDLDGDLRPDLVVTHLDQQTNAVYGNTGSGLFVDRRFATRLAEASYYNVGFGVVLADFDNDADLDLAVANGHILHNAEEWGAGSTYRQPNHVFANDGGGGFVEVAEAGLSVVRSSRGAATGDLDGDGDLELVVSNSDEGAELYENVSEPRGGYLQVEVLDAHGGAAVGARLWLRSAASEQLREVTASSSYMSQSATAVHLGLGEAAARALEIEWPSGERRRFLEPAAGARLLVGWP